MLCSCLCTLYGLFIQECPPYAETAQTKFGGRNIKSDTQVDPYVVSVFKLTILPFLHVVDYVLPFTSSGLLSTECDLFSNITVLVSVNSHCYKCKTCLGICLSSVNVFSREVLFVVLIGYRFVSYSLSFEILFFVFYSYVKDNKLITQWICIILV